MNQAQLREIAAQTIAIGESGRYTTADGKAVDITASVRASRQQTRVVGFEGLAGLDTRPGPPARVLVVPETTLDAAESLAQHTGRTPAILVFASAKHPGGGFRNGMMAQEEDIAYRSALYTALTSRPEYYSESSNNLNGSLYFDKAIHSPAVPVIRNRDYELFTPWLCDMVTAPAPNRGAVLAKGGTDEAVDKAMGRRIDLVLRVLAAAGTKDIVLGAFGCGVFRNRPDLVARLFQTGLRALGGCFETVIFAIPGQQTPNYQAFLSTFPPGE